MSFIHNHASNSVFIACVQRTGKSFTSVRELLVR